MSKITLKEAQMNAKAQKEELLALIKTYYPSSDIDEVDADIDEIKELIIAAVSKTDMAMKHRDGIAAIEAFAFAHATVAAATKAAEAVATKAAATKASAEATATKASAEATATTASAEATTTI